MTNRDLSYHEYIGKVNSRDLDCHESIGKVTNRDLDYHESIGKVTGRGLDCHDSIGKRTSRGLDYHESIGKVSRRYLGCYDSIGKRTSRGLGCYNGNFLSIISNCDYQKTKKLRQSSQSFSSVINWLKIPLINLLDFSSENCLESSIASLTATRSGVSNSVISKMPNRRIFFSTKVRRSTVQPAFKCWAIFLSNSSLD